MMTLVPTPPSGQFPTSPPRYHTTSGSRSDGRQLVLRSHNGSSNSPISRTTVLNADWAKFLSREDVGERKVLKEEEQREREDVYFLISLAKTERRDKHSTSDSHRPLSPANAVTVMEFRENSPRRAIPPPTRVVPISCRRATQQAISLSIEEAELRRWIESLERKMREPVETQCVDSWMVVTGPQRGQFEESEKRKEIEEDWIYEQWQLARTARREKPYYNAGPPPPPLPEPPVPRREVLERESMEELEQKERKEHYDWLWEMYGVRLFSVKRVENVYRTDIEEEECDALHRDILSLFSEDFPSTPFLGILELHTSKMSEEDKNAVSELQDLTFDRIRPVHVGLAWRAILDGVLNPKDEKSEEKQKQRDAATLKIQCAERQRLARIAVEEKRRERALKRATPTNEEEL